MGHTASRSGVDVSHSKKRKRAAAESSPLQCVVASEVGLAGKCGQALARALGLVRVTHQKRQHRRATSLYFYSPPLIEAEVRGENRPVLPLKDGKRFLHVGIDLNFIADKVWRVNHISIGLLQGDPSATRKISLLRAEWQIPEGQGDHGHGQPHWHVLGAVGLDDTPLPTTFAEVVAAEPGFDAFLADPDRAEGIDTAFGHFHYAMATDWHRSPSIGPCQRLEDEESLLLWLEGCVRYIDHQLSHVDRKSGLTAASS